MCGIVGVFNNKRAGQSVKKALALLKNRGRDFSGIYKGKSLAMGHCLHSIVNFVKQPIRGNGVMVSNCEIYNWESLNRTYNLNAKNDSDVLFRLFEKKGVEKIENIMQILNELDGVYAFAYMRDDKLIIARDILGVKPLWFSHAGGFSFASEKKALEKLKLKGMMDMMDINELNPRKILEYDIKENRLNFIDRPFFRIKPELKGNQKKIARTLGGLLVEAVKKRIPQKKFGLLFSGGVDSAVIALILKKLGCRFRCYTAVLDEPSFKAPEDLIYSIRAAEELNLDLRVIRIRLKDIEKYLKTIVPLIEDSNVVKAGVALTLFAACQQAKKDGCRVIFSGLGSEELFAGYERHKQSHNINKECLSGLLKIYERDTYRDDVVTMYNSLELRLPFLDRQLVRYALRIPEGYKIEGSTNKAILRGVAKNLGLNREFAYRRKRAAQYGSNFHKALKRLSKEKGHSRISSYLREFYPAHNVNLGALVSSGKDSIYALYVMLRQNYSIGCIITMKSRNPDSFMFHTPSVELVRLQAESMGIPFIEAETKGEKEKELKDLRKALQLAKERYKIQGVVTGALYSDYQRQRIEKTADSLGLKIFSPLWHISQETEMRELIGNGFKFIITRVAAEGLDKSWLNREITEKDIDRLVLLNKKNAINIAFEGGEAETLVLDAPVFRKRIVINGYSIDEDGPYSATLKIRKAGLEEKTKAIN